MVTFSIPGAAAEALQIDVPSLFPGHFTYTWKRAGKGYRYTITATPDAAKHMLSECQDRANSPANGEGYDQSSTWRNACRVAAAAIRKALGPETTQQTS